LLGLIRDSRELDGQDELLRREPLERRKATLASLRLNEHLAHDGESVFQHVCKMGLEGIVSKRLGSRYRSGQSPTRVVFLVRIALVRRRRYGCGTVLGTSALSPGRGKG